MAANSNCAQYFVVATTHWSDGSKSYRIITSYQAFFGGGGSGGSGSGSGSPGRQIFSEPGDEKATDETYPTCESFEYNKLGTTGVQIVAVNGVWDVVTRFKSDSGCDGIGLAASYQTYYFHLPARYTKSYAASRSADALASAFYDLQEWYRKSPCKSSTGVLASKMDEFIKAEFKKIGGDATRNAPLGWSGRVRPYIENWDGKDYCSFN